MAAAALTGRSLGAVPVGRPLAVPVAQGGKLLEGGVTAALADIVGVPAMVGAGGCLGLDVDQGVVIQVGGNLHVGGVITTGAGIVGVPPDFGAGGSLSLDMSQGVVIRVNVASKG